MFMWYVSVYPVLKHADTRMIDVIRDREGARRSSDGGDEWWSAEDASGDNGGGCAARVCLTALCATT